MFLDIAFLDNVNFADQVLLEQEKTQEQEESEVSEHKNQQSCWWKLTLPGKHFVEFFKILRFVKKYFCHSRHNKDI